MQEIKCEKKQGTVLNEILIELHESSDIATAVNTARRVTRDIGFTENKQFLIASAVSELATNIVRYAGQGRVIIRVIRAGPEKGIEVIASDNGPGIADLEEAMREHYSGGKGLGLGLPSVKRIMDEFELDSAPEKGTKVTARKWKR